MPGEEQEIMAAMLEAEAGLHADPVTITLGTLQRVDPRTIWRHEAHDFTPWLVENIHVLGELLGLELEVEEREAGVGEFSADIVARDLGRDRLVVVENQLEATDHAHLGQLITYAAGLEAPVVVWMSREFREEHRQALDWLNRGEGVGTEYFGVVLEVLRIDTSAPAVNLRLVASPNAWTREARSSAGVEELSSKRSAYKEFFQHLIDELREKHKFTNAKEGQPQNWYSFTSGKRGFTYGMSFAAGGHLRAELYIDGGDAGWNKAMFDRLQQDRVQIEKDFGATLEWERLDDRRACRIALYAPGSIEDPGEVLEHHRRWAVENLLKLRLVFGRRIAALTKPEPGFTPIAK